MLFTENIKQKCEDELFYTSRTNIISGVLEHAYELCTDIEWWNAGRCEGAIVPEHTGGISRTGGGASCLSSFFFSFL